jgi:pimeloyl-ACP methyl ester carboxylesterase
MGMRKGKGKGKGSAPFLLLPGFMCDERLWRDMRMALEAAGPVHIADLSLADSIEAMAAEALAHLDGPAILAGFSMGGAVALELAHQAPDRVAGLALIDANPRAESPERGADRQAQIERVGQGELQAITDDVLLPAYLPDNHDPQVAETIRAMALCLGPEVFVRQAEALRGRRDYRADLTHVSVPTLVLAGEEDLLCPPDWQRAVAEALPAADLVLLEGCGHFAPLERPEETAEALLSLHKRVPAGLQESA